ncbi:unnamed protein product [Vitrella brassicaformis CCMP3155]|uniref:Uncharacterized protein n=2 Tax=Vitrella brassicaformis TaxID=1169539 RepID=A0A0G4GVW8_VITBC|nr:unnamed protein product [Vitrella brassicaformis CCMP3155]|mmetsp:Transcript_52240/g.131308  ORF Transcript_52240/g.131308 Transcript_52240/m.131308 type:complete len:118 (+) Transcript_52240:86-439(+)|eukprot:CEM35027.1 unnamed protein product [Vitrella brassicaformis CCMP3155]
MALRLSPARLAVPKKRGTIQVARKKRLVQFYDALDGHWKRRREWFYQRFHVMPLMPNQYMQTQFRFPGFWPGRFVYQMSEALIASRQADKTEETAKAFEQFDREGKAVTRKLRSKDK